MATTGIVNGTALLLYVDGTAVSHSTNFTLNLSMETRDATTKDSSGWSDKLEGLRSWSIDGEAMMALDATYGFDDLFALYNGRSSATVKFSTEVSGDKFYSGTGYLTSLSQSAGVEDSTTYSFTFDGSDALSESTQT